MVRGSIAEELDRILEPGFGKGSGIALKNVHDRLRGHYGPGSEVTATSRPGESTTVTLMIVRPSGSEWPSASEVAAWPALERRA